MVTAEFCDVHVHLPRQDFGNSFAKKSPINRTKIQAGPKQGHLAATNREEIAAGLPTLYEAVSKITRKLLHEGCEHKTNFIFLNCFTCLRIQIQEVKERNLLNL